jgi:pre-rRNA-processing protein TSR3
MKNFPTTLILRHRRENLKKCSLRGLEARRDCLFLTYPKDALPPLEGYLLLALDGPVLSQQDAPHGLLLIDGTWRHAETILRSLPSGLPRRSLPHALLTAYPRRQLDCADPQRGLASVEALFAAYALMGRETRGLLDRYYWKERFLLQNRAQFIHQLHCEFQEDEQK